MTGRWSSRRGVLISMRHGIRRAWLVSAVVVVLGALPALRAEASIITTGNVAPSLNVPLGDWTLTGSITVGRDLVNPGVLTVDGGSTLWVPDFYSGMDVGGRGGTLTLGTGTVYIDGPGSRIAITGRAALGRSAVSPSSSSSGASRVCAMNSSSA